VPSHRRMQSFASACPSVQYVWVEERNAQPVNAIGAGRYAASISYCSSQTSTCTWCDEVILGFKPRSCASHKMSPTASCQSSLRQIVGSINLELVAASCIGSKCAAHLHHGSDWSVSLQPSTSSDGYVKGRVEIHKITELNNTDSTCKPQTNAGFAGAMLPGALSTRPSLRQVMTQNGLHLTTPRHFFTHHTMSAVMKRTLSTSADTNSVQTEQQPMKQQPAQLPTSEKHVIYKGPWILPFRCAATNTQHVLLLHCHAAAIHPRTALCQCWLMYHLLPAFYARE
jgi:hypothetical protein